MKIEKHFLENSIGIFLNYRNLAEKSFDQLEKDEDFHFQPDEESNSIAILIKHLSGNMISRWTDFLTTDGEKPTRKRDAEFLDYKESRKELMEIWNDGWKVLMDTLYSLKGEDLLRNVMIRGEELTVMQAISRQTAHYSYHIGQIVLLAKHIKGKEWRSLSIPKNKSNEHLKGTYLDDILNKKE